MATIEQLYQTLNERRRPEDVAEMVVELAKESLTVSERAFLEKAAKGSLARDVYGYTSMLQTFAEAKGAGKQIAKAIEIFKLDRPDTLDYNNQKNIEEFINFVRFEPCYQNKKQAKKGVAGVSLYRNSTLVLSLVVLFGIRFRGTAVG